MAEKFRNKYRIKSHRKPNWDYSSEGLYFFTIVTQNRDCNLGKIIYSNGQKQMELSDFGKIVEQEWFKSFEIRNELLLHSFVIMPNHIHAIVEIYNKNRDEKTDAKINDGMAIGMTETPGSMGVSGWSYIVDRDTRPCVSIDPTDSTDPTDPPNPSNPSNPDLLSSIKRNPPIRLPKSISSFIAGFKSSVNTKIDDYIDEHQLDIPKYNRNNHFFQPNYHDHIIRNQREYINISDYIINNPKNWNDDKFYDTK